MSETKRNVETATPPKAPVVVDDYGVQVTGNPAWKQMRGDGSHLVTRPTFSY